MNYHRKFPFMVFKNIIFHFRNRTRVNIRLPHGYLPYSCSLFAALVSNILEKKYVNVCIEVEIPMICACTGISATGCCRQDKRIFRMNLDIRSANQ